FFQAEDGIRDFHVTGVQTCALPIFAPLTGWALVSTSEIQIPTVLFGLVELPHLPLPDTLGDTAEEAHELLAWIGIALFAMHVARSEERRVGKECRARWWLLQ